MNETRFDRLVKKYSSATASGENKKSMDIMGRGGRNTAMAAKGKPKDMKRAIVRLLKYLSHERFLFITAIDCALTNTVTSLVAAYLLRPIMNKFIYFDADNPDISARVSGLAGGLLFLAVIYGVSVLTQWLQQRIMLTVSQRTLRNMRAELYNKLQTLPISYFDRNPAGDIMSRFTNDVDTVGEMLNTTLVQIVSGAITVVGTVILMLYTNALLGGITIVLTPLMIWVSKQIIKKSRAAYSAQQKNLGMLNGFAEETITGQNVVKIFNH